MSILAIARMCGQGWILRVEFMKSESAQKEVFLIYIKLKDDVIIKDNE